MRKVIAGIAIASAAVMAIPPGQASADDMSYLYELGAEGFSGPNWKYLTMGNWVCDNQMYLTDYNMANQIVANTGSGIYTAEAYQIISAAREHLCPAFAV